MSWRTHAMLGASALVMGGLLPGGAAAEAEIIIVPIGSAFDDPTPAVPVGGNQGTTLGAQRLNAFQHAADIWGRQIDSTVPIEVEVSFEDLGCAGSGVALGQAGPYDMLDGIEAEGANPNTWYPVALANRLAGEDLLPGEPDIQAEFNSSVDGDCDEFEGWYYGFDAMPGTRTDLVATALHELAHGLGFTPMVDPETGEMLVPGGSDSFSQHIFDLDLGKTWAVMNDAERAASASNVRRVVWDGAEVTKQRARVLVPGYPTLTLAPAVPDFSGLVSDTGFGAPLGAAPVMGRVVVADPYDGCTYPTNSLAGAIALLEPACAPDQVAQALIAAGAKGVLMAAASSYDLPPLPYPAFEVTVAAPVLTIALSDADALVAALGAGEVRASLGGDAARSVGADPQGRVFLFATRPISGGSTMSHFDPLVRPDLLMEPNLAFAPSHNLDLTLPLMNDIGWTPFCGNGRIDQDEQCDQGAKNSDTTPSACRTNCTPARCGDSVVDQGESCDDGGSNSDQLANACRSNCRAASCGDGVVDRGEQCDQGSGNSASAPDACRLDCTIPGCGDQVVDTGEACDGTEDCTPSCQLRVDLNADEGEGNPNSDAGVTPPRAKDDGCGCRLHRAEQQGRGQALVAFTLLGLVFAVRRRRALFSSRN